MAGQKDACPFALDVDRAPPPRLLPVRPYQTHSFIIYGIGRDFDEQDGNKFLKYYITMTAPVERPRNPCWVWSPLTNKYEWDRDCGGIQPPNGDGPGAGPGAGLAPAPDPISTPEAEVDLIQTSAEPKVAIAGST